MYRHVCFRLILKNSGLAVATTWVNCEIASCDQPIRASFALDFGNYHSHFTDYPHPPAYSCTEFPLALCDHCGIADEFVGQLVVDSVQNK